MPKVFKEENDCTYRLYNEDCLEVLPRLERGISCVIADMPYGSTDCLWDSILPLKTIWEMLQKIVSPDAAILLFCSQPFTTELGNSGKQWLRYSYVWDKKMAGNFVLAKRVPMKTHEDILVFALGKKSPFYFPIMEKREKPLTVVNSGGTSKKYKSAIPTAGKMVGSVNKTYTHRYPISILKFDAVREGLHPTQKPVTLLEYLIRTHTHPGDTVLDFCMGSGSTGVACGRTGRSFIGIENDTKHGYFATCQRRIKEAYGF